MIQESDDLLQNDAQDALVVARLGGDQAEADIQAGGVATV